MKKNKPGKNVFLLGTILAVFGATQSFSLPALASDAQMKETLVRIIHQLQSIKPLIEKAESEQPQNPRFKVHFDKFQDSQGQWHNGLRQDIDAIQQSLIHIVNQSSIEPRTYQPISDDYIDVQGE